MCAKKKYNRKRREREKQIGKHIHNKHMLETRVRVCATVDADYHSTFNNK